LEPSLLSNQVPEFLHVFARRAVGCFRNQLVIFEQGSLTGGYSRIVDLASNIAVTHS
jgi:hypothetical protein